MPYPGGKNGSGVYQQIINQIPPHRVYIEAFLGGGAVLMAKRPAACSIAIDLDDDVIKGWQWRPPGFPLQLECTDALAFLRDYNFTGDEFVYCDPPYVMSSRRQHRRIYRYELSDADHAALLAVLLRLPCPVMISGYHSDLYASVLSAWRTHTFQTRTRGGGMATEWLWMNYPSPVELHDYRYLGADFRERERIKRKKARWAARLAKMPMLERRALLMVLRDHDAWNGDARS